MADSIDSLDELMQMAVIDLIRVDAKNEGPNRVSGRGGERIATRGRLMREEVADHGVCNLAELGNW